MLASWLVAAGLPIFLYSTGLFAIFTPLPLAICYHRRGVGQALVALVAGFALLSVFYHILNKPVEAANHVVWMLPLMNLAPVFTPAQISYLGMLEFLYYGVLGLLLVRAGQGERMEWGIARSVMGLGFLLMVGLVVFSAIFSVNVFGQIRALFQNFFAQWLQSGQDIGLEEEEMVLLRGHLPAMVDAAYYLLPAFLINGTLVACALNVMLFKRWFDGGRLFGKWGDFAQWKLPDSWVWFPVSVGALYFLNNLLLHQTGLKWLSLNILLVNLAVYFFQGMAIVIHFWRRPIPPLMRMAAYLVFFVLFQVVAVVIVLLGLFNFWFDFRKIKGMSGAA